MDEKTTALFQDQEFMKSVLTMGPEEAQKAFEKAGGSITVAELEEIAAETNKVLQKQKDGELDMDALDTVAGGKSFAKRVEETAWGVAIGAAAYGVFILGW